MRTTSPISIGFIWLAAVAMATASWVGCSADIFSHDTVPASARLENADAKSRTFEFTYVSGLDKVPENAESLDLWIPVPTDSPVQEIEVLSIEAPVRHELGTDSLYGNLMAHFRFERDQLKPFEVRMQLRVTRFERRDDQAGSIVLDPVDARFLRADAVVKQTGEVAQLAAGATDGRDGGVDAGRGMYHTVLERMRYSKDGEGWGRGSTEHACREGFGNCTDFLSLFIGMSRSQGDPARFLMGFPLPEERGEGTVGGYHCWAEFFVDGVGWVPVDASEADKHPEMEDYYFGSLTENRVTFTKGRDITLVPEQAGEPLNFFIYPYAEVDGAPFDGMSRKFSYKDL